MHQPPGSAFRGAQLLLTTAITHFSSTPQFTRPRYKPPSLSYVFWSLLSSPSNIIHRGQSYGAGRWKTSRLHETQQQTPKAGDGRKIAVPRAQRSGPQTANAIDSYQRKKNKN